MGWRDALRAGRVEAFGGKRQNESETRHQQEPWFHKTLPGIRAAARYPSERSHLLRRRFQLRTIKFTW
jgi:hypothetical protein